MTRSLRASWLAIGLPLALAAAIVVPACGGGGGGGGAAPLAITLRAPASGAVDVGRSSVLYIRFNRTLDPSTVNNTNITLTGAANVPCTVTYEACKAEIRIVPNAALDQNQLHTVTVKVGLEDSSDVAYPAETTYTFTTANSGDSTPPGAAAVIGPSGGDENSLDLDWTGSADGTATYDIYVSTTSGCFDFALAPYTTSAAGTTNKTITGLTSNTVYYFVVRARDAAGNVDTNVTEQPGKTNVSYAVDVYPIFNQNCRSCHSPGGEADDAGITINFTSAANGYATIYDVAPFCATCCPDPTARRIKPGGMQAAADLSFLLNKVKSKIDAVAPWCGDAMPRTGGALSNAQYTILEDWVKQGAPNN